MRAILLAAGMGTRLRPLTENTPKSLIEVNGKPLLERQIEAIKDRGIDEIIVVTGYLSEKFNYLNDKYGVKLIHNDKYDVYNNIYTMYLVREYLSDSYVVDADVYINKNFFRKDIEKSTYFSEFKKGFNNEWKLIFDDEYRVYDIEVCSGEGYILSGVSYWSEKDGKLIVKELESTVRDGDFISLYWDNIVKENIKRLSVKIEKLEEDSIFEIDNLEELQALKDKLCIN